MDDKRKLFILIENNDLDDFERAVSDYLDDGYQLVAGGFNSLYCEDEIMYHQTMYLPTESPNGK